MDQPRTSRAAKLVGWTHGLGAFASLGAVLGSLTVLALIYLGYDLVMGKVSPCESIFRESSVGLSTHIKFLKVEGELQIGREAVTELDERAQMAALDLKTCCTVLDAGRIDPEQFLQCKAKARAYDARVEDIATLLRAAMGDKTATTASVSPAKSEPPPANPAIAQAVEAARTVSREFNQQVVQVQKEQALQSLQAVPASHAEISAAEREPNDDILTANIIELDKWVRAAINPAKDNDFYTFTTPDTYRDWIRVEVQNQSTTWDPNLELFDASKASLGSVHNATAGGDLAYDFVAPPKTRFTVRASSYYGGNVGVYLIHVVAMKAYDAYEPNDDILSAKKISEGAAVKAKIMDKDDVDFFVVDGANRERQMTVKIANGSTTLHPNVVVYDASKSEIGNQHNATASGDLSYTFKAPPGAAYVRVSDYYVQSPGDYTLTVSGQ